MAVVIRASETTVELAKADHKRAGVDVMRERDGNKAYEKGKAMHQKGHKTAVDNIDTRPDSSNSIKENTATGYSQRHLFNGIILRRSHFPRKLCREKRTSRRVGGGGERSLSLARLFFSLGRPKLYRPTRPGTVVTEFVWQHKAVLEGPSEVERRRGALMYWRLQGKRDEGRWIRSS